VGAPWDRPRAARSRDRVRRAAKQQALRDRGILQARGLGLKLERERSYSHPASISSSSLAGSCALGSSAALVPEGGATLGAIWGDESPRFCSLRCRGGVERRRLMATCVTREPVREQRGLDHYSHGQQLALR
jgi:hypothetical protein